jgi:hypothetical protein
MLEIKCSEADMKTPLAHYKEMYSSFGRERSAAIAFHMSQLKSLLFPNTAVSKMTLWSLQQDDEFYNEKMNPKTFRRRHLEHAQLRAALDRGAEQEALEDSLSAATAHSTRASPVVHLLSIAAWSLRTVDSAATAGWQRCTRASGP